MAARRLWTAMAGLEHRPAAAEAAEAEASMAGFYAGICRDDLPLRFPYFPKCPSLSVPYFPKCPPISRYGKGFFSIWKDAFPFLQLRCPFCK
jgi:hypothetical protein